MARSDSDCGIVEGYSSLRILPAYSDKFAALIGRCYEASLILRSVVGFEPDVQILVATTASIGSVSIQ